MLKNYFKIAFRNLWKNRTISTINVLGLSVGISAALVIWMIVYYDISFDKFHPNRDRIYRAVSDLNFGSTVINTSGVPMPLADAMRHEVAGVQALAHIFDHDMDVKAEGHEQKFRHQKNILFADDQYFVVYPYKWLYGSPAALTKAYQTVLTESRAEQYFPGMKPADVVGRTLMYNDSIQVTVAGIVEAFKERSDLQAQEFVSFSTIPAVADLKEVTAWGRWNSTNSSCNLHMLLKPGVSPDQIERQLLNIRKKYLDKDNKNLYHLQPLNDFHFNSKFDLFDQRQASWSTIYGLSTLVIFLLLLGCINFINIQTAQAGERAREIGIRKAMGSSRGKLIWQFLGESLVLTFFAAILSLLMVPLILRLFDHFIPDGVTLQLLKEWQVFLFIPALIIIVSVLSGLYPAFVLARFQPVKVLRNNLHGVKGKARLRQVLTVSQFAVALVLIMATVIVSRQTQYAYRKNLGFSIDSRLYVMSPPGVKDLAPLKSSWMNVPEIEHLSLSYRTPSSNGTVSSHFGLEGEDPNSNDLTEVKYIDTAYLPLYNLHLLAGRNILPSDTARELIINEAFVHKAGFKTPAAAIGRTLRYNDVKMPIVGVVADFHSKSLRETIKPIVLTSSPVGKRGLHVAFKKNVDVPHALDKMKTSWEKLFPNDPFDYKFVDKTVAGFYEKEAQLIKLLSWATGVAVFISCLGLLGLAIYATRQRTREIGIRKVLGASLMSIMGLFSKDIIKLVIIAICIATPVVWIVMHNWLNDFAYRISMLVWVFPVCGLLAILLAVCTVSAQSLKAAMVNPVKSLKSE